MSPLILDKVTLINKQENIHNIIQYIHMIKH